MILPTDIYHEIIFKTQHHKGHFRHLEAKLVAEYGLPRNTVSSLISNEYKRKMKKNHYKVFTESLFQRFLNSINESEPSNIIANLASEIDVAPTLLARVILEKYYSGCKASTIKMYIKDTTLIEYKDLAYEIYLCTLYDDQYGNITEITRHSLGQEYEYYLQKTVIERNLSYQSEDDLRLHGYDKTPDIKLNIPFAVDGFVVNWIESKALFADKEVHKRYVEDQYSCYWNRFGTGMVIYWLGFVESIVDPSEKRFIVRYDFPTNIILTNPLSIASIPKEDV